MVDTSIDHCLRRARILRNNYSDEIPTEILHNIHSTPKVSIGYWQHVGFILNFAGKKGYTDDHYHQEFRYHFKTELEGKPARKENIDFINSLLDEFISELESKVNSQ